MRGEQESQPSIFIKERKDAKNNSSQWLLTIFVMLENFNPVYALFLSSTYNHPSIVFLYFSLLRQIPSLFLDYKHYRSDILMKREEVSLGTKVGRYQNLSVTFLLPPPHTLLSHPCPVNRTCPVNFLLNQNSGLFSIA